MSRRKLIVLNYFVNKPIGYGFVRIHDIVAVGVEFDLFDVLSSGVSHDPIETLLQANNLVRMNLNIAGLSACPAEGLVDENPRIGQDAAFAFGSRA